MVYENRKLLTGLKLIIQAKIKRLYFLQADNAQKLLLSRGYYIFIQMLFYDGVIPLQIVMPVLHKPSNTFQILSLTVLNNYKFPHLYHKLTSNLNCQYKIDHTTCTMIYI